MSPTREGGGPHPPYHESFLENIVGVSWGSGFSGVYIVVLHGSGLFAWESIYSSILATSINGIKWNFWKIPSRYTSFNPEIWTISGGPGPNNTFVLQAAGAYESNYSGFREQAVLFHSTNFGKSWYDNTPPVYGAGYPLGAVPGSQSEIDGGGYSNSARAAIATTWAYANDGVWNTVLMHQGGKKWKELARGRDGDFGQWEFPGGIIPADTICFNTAGGGFDEFPPIYWDPIATKCPYIGPDGQSGTYQGHTTAIGPPGILNSGRLDDNSPYFVLTIFQNGAFVDVPVKQLNDMKLECTDMFFCSNFGFPPPALERSTTSAALTIS